MAGNVIAKAIMRPGASKPAPQPPAEKPAAPPSRLTATLAKLGRK